MRKNALNGIDIEIMPMLMGFDVSFGSCYRKIIVEMFSCIQFQACPTCGKISKCQYIYIYLIFPIVLLYLFIILF